MPIGTCWLRLLISTASSMTRFMKGSKPRRMPFICRAPFSLTAMQKREISLPANSPRKQILTRQSFVHVLLQFRWVCLAHDDKFRRRGVDKKKCKENANTKVDFWFKWCLFQMVQQNLHKKSTVAVTEDVPEWKCKTTIQALIWYFADRFYCIFSI